MSDRLRQRYFEVISKKRGGLLASLTRGGLFLASLPYGLVVRGRNGLYDHGWKRIHRVEVPVVSVGNLTAGGTGKTPMVEYLARFYRDSDRRVAIASRGYGQEGRNDEALILDENLPDVPHLQGPDRVASARIAIDELESELLLLDDGFQHRRLARDLDVVLIDATQPWGFGHVLPRGLLREPASGLRRADAVVLTRCDQVEEAELARLEEQVAKLVPDKLVVETAHRPLSLGDGEGNTEPSDYLQNRSVVAFSGIGNPEAFERTLVEMGANVLDSRSYPDHHRYTREDIEELRQWASGLPTGTLVLTTQKDLVKIRLRELGDKPLWALRIRLEVRSHEAELHALLRSVWEKQSA